MKAITQRESVVTYIKSCLIFQIPRFMLISKYRVISPLRIFQFGCIINTKLPSCVDINRRTLLGFHTWCSESTRPTDSCFQGTSCENLMMYDGLYQHTHQAL